MKSNNEINKPTDDTEEKSKETEPENNLARSDSANNVDNETNNILEKEENNINNNVIELDSPTNINNEIKKKSFFHDKDITEDSIIYFSNKLKQSNYIYKIFLYTSIILYLIDIFI